MPCPNAARFYTIMTEANKYMPRATPMAKCMPIIPNSNAGQVTASYFGASKARIF